MGERISTVLIEELVDRATARERRRIRRAIAVALMHLKSHATHIGCGDCTADADAIDAATRAPKRRSRNA